MSGRAYVAVIGLGDEHPGKNALAREVGRGLAEAWAILVCGGLGGVMAAAAEGAAEAGGLSVGLLPGDSRAAAAESLTVAVPTGLGEARNALVVRAADAVIAIGGGFGTLSEIALALKAGKGVVALDSWRAEDSEGERLPVSEVATPTEAVRLALELARRQSPG